MDEQRLLDGRKLALIVDLDKTVIHTTNDLIAEQWLCDGLVPDLHEARHLFSTVSFAAGLGYNIPPTLFLSLFAQFMLAGSHVRYFTKIRPHTIGTFPKKVNSKLEASCLDEKPMVMLEQIYVRRVSSRSHLLVRDACLHNGPPQLRSGDPKVSAHGGCFCTMCEEKGQRKRTTERGTMFTSSSSCTILGLISQPRLPAQDHRSRWLPLRLPHPHPQRDVRQDNQVGGSYRSARMFAQIKLRI